MKSARSYSQNMARTYLFLLSLLAASYVCDTYKILVIFPFPSKSHSFLGNGVVRHLLNAGHEVTLLTPYINKSPPPNLHQVDTSSLIEFMKDGEKMRSIKEIMDGKVPIADPTFILYVVNVLSTKTLEDINVQNFLKDKSQHFDLVIAEWLFNELYASFAAVFNAPLVWFSSTEPDTILLGIIYEYLNPSYNGYYTTDSPPFTFMQRLSELWYTIKIIAFRETVISYLQSREYSRLIVPHIESRGMVAPAFSDLKYNASLVLGNSHVSMGVPMRLPQMYKHIGGFHIEDTIEPLPEDLKKIMDSSKDGVIYFSMGSSLQSKDLPDDLKMDIVNMFGALKQTVLWKFEEELPNMPKNLHILKWAPQKSILAHPNCVMFITHGGMLSTTETINVGIPTIGIPVLGDQVSNVVRAVNKGFAIKVDLSYTMINELKAAIEEILRNPKYAQKAKEMSFVFHDRPTKPGDELVHWAEHVIKTQGAPHLRSPALLVPWYQKYYLDLLIFIIVMYMIIYRILVFIKPYIMLYVMPYYQTVKSYVFSFFKRNDMKKTN